MRSFDCIYIACRPAEGELIRSRFDAMSAGKAYLAVTALKTVYHAISIEEKLKCKYGFAALTNKCLT